VRAIARAEAANSGGVSSTNPVLPSPQTNRAIPQISTNGNTNLRGTRASCVRHDVIAYGCSPCSSQASMR
jgi:hypothetical protein